MHIELSTKLSIASIGGDDGDFDVWMHWNSIIRVQKERKKKKRA